MKLDKVLTLTLSPGGSKKNRKMENIKLSLSPELTIFKSESNGVIFIRKLIERWVCELNVSTTQSHRHI